MHKVWIADDDEAIRLVLEESLSSSGFITKTFSSGEELIKEFEKSKPDLVITDVQMPGMLGYDILKHINNNFTAEDGAIAKLWSTELQFKVIDECLQLFGGYGYMHEYPIAKAFMDSRVQRIYGGTSEIMKEIISRNL